MGTLKGTVPFGWDPLGVLLHLNGLMMTSVHVSEMPLIKVSIQDQQNHVSANVSAER